MSSGGPPLNGTQMLDPDAVSTSLDALRRVLRALRVAARDTLVTSGLSAAQLYVLRALADDADASLSELAARTMTDRTSVKAVVDRLVASGLVTKKTSTEDRRRAAVRLTPRGRTVLRGAPRPPTALLLDGLKQLDPGDLRRLARGLRALTRAMQIDGERPGMLFEDPGTESVERSPARRRRRQPA